MIYIRLKEDTDIVEYIHYMPYHPTYGIKSRQEEGFFTEALIPGRPQLFPLEDECIEQEAVLHYNVKENSFHYTIEEVERRD